MACLRSLSRRNLYQKLFYCKTSRPLLCHIKDDTESNSSYSSLLIRKFHRKVLSEEAKKMSFAQPVGSGLLLCRHMSSSSFRPEEFPKKIDVLGNVVEELSPVESMATIESFSFPGDCVQYVINGIHELTGFNWWMSIVLTAFLVNGLMSPVSLRISNHLRELRILARSVEKVRGIIKICDPQALAKNRKWEAQLMNDFEEVSLSFLKLFALDAFIYISFINGISTMATRTPAFENGGILWFTDLSTPDSFYMLPILTGFAFWLTAKVSVSQTNRFFRMIRLPLFPVIFILLQATIEYEAAVYLYMISSRIYLSTFFMMLRSKEIVKLRSILGWSDVPVATVTEQQRITARLISLMREFIRVVKQNDKK